MARATAWELVFDPLRDFSIVESYHQYHAFIDFSLYFIIFLSVAQHTLGRRFSGNAGKMLSLTVGLMLAVSLVLAEDTLGFTIKSLGSIAAAIIIFLVALNLFHLMKEFGFGNIMAASSVIIVLYVAMQMLTPQFLKNKSWPHIVIFITLLIIVFALATHSSGNSFVHRLARQVKKQPKENGLHKNLVQEKRLVKNDLHTIKEQKKGSKGIIQKLMEMKKILIDYGNTWRGKKLFAQKIKEIAPEDHELMQRLRDLKDMDTKLQQFDISTFTELGKQFGKLSIEEKRIFKKEILAERKKIAVEERLKKLSDAAETYQKELRTCLNQAVKNMNNGRLSKKWLEKAISFEKGAFSLLSEMKKLESQLVHLTTKEIRVSKQQE